MYGALKFGLAALLAAVLPPASVLAAVPSGKLLLDFETAEQEGIFETVRGDKAVRSAEHTTGGEHSLMVRCGAYLTSWKLPGDWSGYESLEFDAFNASGGVVTVNLLVADEAWKEEGKSTYWNRHNSHFNLLPGENVASIPVTGLYRGEAGSRNNDIKRDIDPGSIVRVDLGFQGPKGAVYLDSFRLVKGTKPASVRAFDFGPESQTVWPGFTPVSWNTLYSKESGYGFSREQGGPGAARDDTFPTRLFRDWTAFENGEFLVDLPPGRYRVWLVFSDCGYWGGEYSQYTVRSVFAEGREMIGENRRDRGGSWEPLYLFQDVEPKPGDDLAALYFDPLFRPRTFEMEISDGRLDLSCKADAPWSSRIAALAIYPAGDAQAAAWIAKIESDNRAEFSREASPIELPKAGPVPAGERNSNCLVFVPGTDEEVHFNYVPDAARLGGAVRLAGAPGETVSGTFGLRPLKDLKTGRIRAGVLQGPGGAQLKIKTSVVRNLAKRGFNTLRWRLKPWYLHETDRIELPAELSRQFWLNVEVPEGAEPGLYRGEVQVSARGFSRGVRVELEVLPLRLDALDFSVCFYGMRKEWLEYMHGYGMTTLSGGPNIRFAGFGAGAEPELEFGPVDEYMDAIRKAGYRRTVLSYQGPAGLQGIGYEGIEEKFAEWGEPAGLDALSAAQRVFAAIEQHAAEREWLPYVFPMCDEPRVREQTRRILDSIRFLRRAAPGLKLAGSYSVDFSENDDPLLHQELFRALDVPILNVHDEAVMEQARKLDKPVYIYNQGRDRFIFGAYLYSERAKGVKGLCQWHMFATHGYQFFDLDGREPDDGIIALRTEGICPTLDLERVRQGIYDLRYLLTLERLATEAGTGELAPARVLLDGIKDGIGLDRRSKPTWLDLDELRRQAAAEIIRLQKTASKP